MKKFNLCIRNFFFALFLFSNLDYAQISFIKTFGTENDDWAECVQQTPDSGYVLTGMLNFRTEFEESGKTFGDFYIMKTNKYGDSLWCKYYNINDIQRGKDLIVTEDSGYLAIGYAESIGTYGYTADIYVVRTDSRGDTIWTKRIGDSTHQETASCVLQTKDNGFIIGGSVDTSGCLFKLNENGSVEWMKIGVIAGDIIQKDDGGYVTCAGYLMFKSDSLGNKIWEKNIGGILDHPELIGGPTLHSFVQTDDGGFFLAGTKPFLEGDTYHYVSNYIYLVRTDEFGDTLWTKLLKDNTGSTSSCDKLPDGNFIIAGTKRLNENESGACLIKIDSIGNVLWTRIITGGNQGYGFNSVHQTFENGFIASGINVKHNEDILLIKTNNEGEVTSVLDADISIPPDYMLYQNYPNPFNPSTTISYTLPVESNVKITIYDLTGSIVKSFIFNTQSAGYKNVLWDSKNNYGESVSSGIYIYSIKAVSLERDGKSYTKSAKLMLMK